MGILDYVLVAIRSLAIVSNNPALGGGSNLRVQEISKFLATLGELVEKGDEALDELEEFTSIVDSMARNNRGPTKEEWASLRSRSDSAHARLQKMKAQFDAGEAPEGDGEEEVPEEITAEVLVERNTKDELLEMAADRSLELSSSLTKAEIAEAIVVFDRENVEE